MTLSEMGSDYIKESEQIYERMKELQSQLKSDNLSYGKKRHLRRRIMKLEDLYWTSRSTGRQLLREYGSEERV